MTQLIAGGIVGIASNTKIINCSNNELVLCNIEDITSLTSSQIDVKIGGICGLASNCEINHCLNDYLIQTNTGYSAGIVAIATDTDIKDCVNNGKINNIDSYYYSNSAGIVCSIKNSELRDFLNCVNFGEIISYTKNAIATGAGISSNISNAIVGMSSNFGSVDVMARGTMSSSFKYTNYSHENCNIIEDSSDLEKWNEFIKANYNYELSTWDLTNPDEPQLQPSLWFDARAFSNCGQTSIYIFSADPMQQYQVELFNNEGYIIRTHTDIFNHTYFTNLTPNENYTAKIKNKFIPDSYPFYVDASVHLDSPNFSILLDNIDYEACDYIVLWDIKGLSIENAEISVFDKSTESICQQIEQTKGSMSDLLENTTYVIKPSITTTHSKIEFTPTEFATAEFIPEFEITPTMDKATLRCTNYMSLNDRSLGFIFNDSIYSFKEDENIELCNLSYNTHYSIIPIVIRDKITTNYQELDFITELDGYFKPISLSRNGAIVVATVYNGQVPDYYNTYYQNFYIEYRNISDPTDIRSNYETVYVVDSKNLIAAYLPFTSDDIIQYRVYSKHNNEYHYHSWYIVDRNEAFDEIVEPHFFDCRSIINTSHYISCQPIKGDEEIIEWGIAYKYEKSTGFSETSLKLSSVGGTIYMQTEKFVPNLTYLIKFYGRTKEKTYYSQTYSYVNYILSPVEDNPESSVDIINIDTTKSKPLYYYNMFGLQSKQPFRGINIVVFEDGHKEKMIINDETIR